MNEFSAFIRPLVALLFIWTGYRRLRYPIKFVPKPAQTSPATPSPDLASQRTPPPNLAKPRLIGALWLILGIMLLIISPIHFRLSSPKFASASVAPSNNANGAILAVQQLAHEYATKHRIPSLSISIIADGAEHIFSFGTTSLSSSAPIDDNTLFEIGSITKVFTGLLLAKLVHQKRLSLDDPLAKFLPSGTELSEPARKINLRHLTTHIAGLPMMPPNYMSLGRTLRIFAGLDPYNTYSESELLNSLAHLKLNSTIGEKAEYSNYGISLLGYALTSGAINSNDAARTYESTIRREILDPLGMTNTTITVSPPAEKHFARGYSAVMRIGPTHLARPAPYWNLSNAFAGAGALRSSARDMLTFLKANMGLHKSPLDDVIQLSHQQLAEYDTRHAIGMNWFIRKPSGDLPRLFWHNGGTGGFRSFIAFTEDKRFGVVVLAAKTTDVDPLGVDILRSLIKTAAPDKAVPNLPQPTAAATGPAKNSSAALAQ